MEFQHEGLPRVLVQGSVPKVIHNRGGPRQLLVWAADRIVWLTNHSDVLGQTGLEDDPSSFSLLKVIPRTLGG